MFRETERCSIHFDLGFCIVLSLVGGTCAQIPCRSIAKLLVSGISGHYAKVHDQTYSRS